MITDPVAARRYLLRRFLAGLTMEGDPPVAVSPEVATSLRTLEGPARMEGVAWREDTTPRKALDMFPDACQRCGDTPLGIHTMSRFNTDWLCMPCRELEMQHSDYDRADKAETAAVRAGDYNFPGVGCPLDLVESSRAARAAREAAQ